MLTERLCEHWVRRQREGLDRLADLADQRGDADELAELLDEGCRRAGHCSTDGQSRLVMPWRFNVFETPATTSLVMKYRLLDRVRSEA